MKRELAFTPEEDAILLAGLARGDSHSTIAATLTAAGKPRKKCAVWRRMKVLNRTDRKPARGAWSEEEMALLRELWPSHSMRQIAEIVSHRFSRNRTRNAVCGQLARMGLMAKFPEAKMRDGRSHVKKVATRPKPLPKKPVAPLVTTPVNNGEGVLFLKRRENRECAHFINDAPLAELRCCGLPIEPGSTFQFCRFHMTTNIEKREPRRPTERGVRTFKMKAGTDRILQVSW